MSQYRIIVRLAEEPRAVELEVTAPAGTRSIDPLDEALFSVGAKAVGKHVLTTASRAVFVAKLVELTGNPLEPDRIGEVLETLRRNLSVRTRTCSRAA